MKFDEEALCNSPTLQKLSVLAQINPINIDNSAEVKSALASAEVRLINALDNGSIQFNNRQDSDALFKMLFVCHQFITQIRPESPTQH